MHKWPLCFYSSVSGHDSFPGMSANRAELLAKALNEAGEGLTEQRKIEAADEIANNMAKQRNVS